MTVLTDGNSLKRAFYRLTGTSADDGGLTEHDDVGEETVEQYLQYGLWDAQDYMIQVGHGDRWVSTTAALTFTGADNTDGGRYADLPEDFLRAAGDDKTSALRRPNGRKWGTEIPWIHRHRVSGNHFYFQNERLWITRGANPPTDLVMDYHHRHVTIDDGTEVDFPVHDRALIVAFAASRAAEDAWIPEDSRVSMIDRNLAKQKRAALARSRRSQTPKKMEANHMIGSHWWGGN